jgi:cystathionine beta-lyase/cystathionine gamma-synthase
MKAHYEGTLAVAKHLESHPKVASVLYPMLDSFNQATLARKLFSGGSGLFSFRLKTRKLEDIMRFTDSLTLFKRAVSWGGYESLVFPDAVRYPNESSIPVERMGLVRIHIGLEDPNDLIDDLDKALGLVSV